MRRTMPPQKPATSKQDYGTPWAFVHAAERLLGISTFSIDLAATKQNKKAKTCITPERDSLKVGDTLRGWHDAIPRDTWAWLNPRFRDIGAYVARCAGSAAMGDQIAFLVPASVGANWWRDYVHGGRCVVLCLNGRLTFEGEQDPYPKDCALILWTGAAERRHLHRAFGTDPLRQYLVWDWRNAEGPW